MTQPISDTDSTLLPFEREVNVVGKYILSHPFWRRTFVNFEPSDVIKAVLSYMQSNHIKLAYNGEGEICGVLLFTPRKDEGLVEVNHLLGEGQGIIIGALEVWRTEYPDCVVTLQRRNKPRVYEPSQFFESI